MSPYRLKPSRHCWTEIYTAYGPFALPSAAYSVFVRSKFSQTNDFVQLSPLFLVRVSTYSASRLYNNLQDGVGVYVLSVSKGLPPQQQLGMNPNGNMSADKSTDKPKILVIDGGVFRGLASLMIIDEIMKAVMTRGRKRMLPCDVFDLICGTSVGGFIAVLLGRLGLDCGTAIEYYEKGIKTLVQNEHDIIWDKIADDAIDTTDFREFLNKTSRDSTGSADAPMNIARDQDAYQYSSTKTFVTIMEEGAYPTHCHVIRSYTPHVQQKLPPSINFRWTIRDAVMATIATPIYMDLHKVRPEQEYGFKDAGYGGYNNPIELALHEWKNNSPSKELGTIISLGTGLGGLLPNPPPLSGDPWVPSEQYVLDACENLYKEKLPIERDEEYESEIKYSMRDLIGIAADSSEKHQQFHANSAIHCDNYYRIDEPFGLSRFDLVDVYRAELIRDNVNVWLRRGGSQIVAEIANQLVEESHTFQDKGSATFVKPPPPPPDTIKDYNPLMDEPRPTRIQDYLRYYEVMFIVDDSGSMSGRRWREARDALLDVADHAFQLQAHTVSMRFLNHPTYIRGLQGSAKVVSIFDSVNPRDRTPTGAVLKAVFDQHLNRVDTAISQLEYTEVPPLDIIVITDGEPTDNPVEVITETVRRLKNKHYHPNTMGVQFVQIGNDADAERELKALVKGDNGSIVDTVPYRGKLSPDALKRILLGGMHPNVRAMLPLYWLGQ